MTKKKPDYTPEQRALLKKNGLEEGTMDAHSFLLEHATNKEARRPKGMKKGGVKNIRNPGAPHRAKGYKKVKKLEE